MIKLTPMQQDYHNKLLRTKAEDEDPGKRFKRISHIKLRDSICNKLDLHCIATVANSTGSDAFIIFTGKGRKDVVIDALNFGADLYLEKSPDVRGQVSDVLTKVKNLISARSEDREERERCRQLHQLMGRLPCTIFWLKEGEDEAHVLAGDAASSFLPAPLCCGRVHKSDISELIHPQDREKVQNSRSAAFRKARDYSIRYVIQVKQGEERRVMERGFPSLRPDGYFIEGYIIDLDSF